MSVGITLGKKQWYKRKSIVLPEHYQYLSDLLKRLFSLKGKQVLHFHLHLSILPLKILFYQEVANYSSLVCVQFYYNAVMTVIYIQYMSAFWLKGRIEKLQQRLYSPKSLTYLPSDTSQKKDLCPLLYSHQNCYNLKDDNSSNFTSRERFLNICLNPKV